MRSATPLMKQGVSVLPYRRDWRRRGPHPPPGLSTAPAFRAQPGDMQPRTEDLIQMLLLDPVVLAFTGNA